MNWARLRVRAACAGNLSTTTRHPLESSFRMEQSRLRCPSPPSCRTSTSDESETRERRLCLKWGGNSVYLIELTNIYPRAQRDVWTLELSTTFPDLRVITTDHR